jgi:hypothetical protein
MVDTIWLEFCIPTTWSTIFIKYVSILIILCPNLLEFVLNPVISAVNNQPPQAPIPSPIIKALITSRCCDTIEQIIFAGALGPTAAHIELIMQNCPQLRSFSSTRPFQNSALWPLSGSGHRSLEYLRLHEERWQPSPNETFDRVIRFPRLRHLSFVSSNANAAATEMFFDVHGHQLTSLAWSTSGFISHGLLETIILPRCPNVTQLAFSFTSSTSPLTESQAFPEVRHLWITGFFSGYPATHRNSPTSVTGYLHAAFPNLKTVCFPDSTADNWLEPRDAWLEYITLFSALSIRCLDSNGNAFTADLFRNTPKPGPKVKGILYEEDSSDSDSSSDTSYDQLSPNDGEDVDSDFAREVASRINQVRTPTPFRSLRQLTFV